MLNHILKNYTTPKTPTNTELAKIKDFASWIDKNGNPVSYQYVSLDNPDNYSDKPFYCGIVKFTDSAWLFIHQDYPAPGDFTESYLQCREYRSLDSLIQKETEEIESRLYNLLYKREFNDEFEH